MGKALYRKYRSKSLSEIVGQEHITKTLQNALSKGIVSHAYLFTGPHGVGKTSVARIFAYSVNQLPYAEDETHLDIIEIDAASNRRIDEIRSLRDRIHNAPASAKYKVYIIDEVHMLTREAFNALLKTLEEPPAHVIFILATTEAHKLPETIISRTQRFTFKPIDPNDAVKHLKSIAKEEKINITDDALRLIAEHGNGSFRDSISLLDQASSFGKNISLADIENILGLAPYDVLKALLSAVRDGDTAQIVSRISDLNNQGFQAAMVARQLGAVLRAQLIDRASSMPPQTVTLLLKELIEVPASHDPAAKLELTLLSAGLLNAPQSSPKTTAPDAIEPAVSPPAPISQPKPQQPDKKASPVKAKIATAKTSKQKATDSTLTQEDWDNVLAAIKKRHNTLYSLIRMARPQFEAGEVSLELSFPFHQKRLNDDKNKQVIVAAIKEITGANVQLSCLLVEAEQAAPTKNTVGADLPVDDTLDTISNIFGSAEVLES